jgi:hypothetical protein
METDEYGRIYHFSENLDATGDSSCLDKGAEPKPCSKEEANLLSSATAAGKHMPVIDIDIPCRYVPSTTPGHGHLYIDKEMEFHQFMAMLYAMESAGVVQTGYRKFTEQRGNAFVRPPWVKKPNKEGK